MLSKFLFVLLWLRDCTDDIITESQNVLVGKDLKDHLDPVQFDSTAHPKAQSRFYIHCHELLRASMLENCCARSNKPDDSEICKNSATSFKLNWDSAALQS